MEDNLFEDIESEEQPIPAPILEQAPQEELFEDVTPPEVQIEQAVQSMLAPEEPQPESIDPMEMANAMVAEMKGIPNPDAKPIAPPAPFDMGPKAPNILPLQDEEIAVLIPALLEAYPSMAQTGILVDRADRVNMAIAILSNKDIPSTLAADQIDKLVRTGKPPLELLPQEWFDSRALQIQRRANNGI